MRKKTILAVLTACMMLFTLIPSASFAATERKELKSKVPVSAGIDEDYAEQLKQLALEWLDELYIESIQAKENYCADIWKEIQTSYKGMMESIASMSEEDLYVLLVDEEGGLGNDFNLLSMLGEMTWVRSTKQDLPGLKTSYQKEIEKQYKTYKASMYSDYYWDRIQDGRYVGLKLINGAQNFRTAISGYLTAMNAMENSYTREDLQDLRMQANADIKQYVNLGLDPARYTAYDWKRLTAIRDRAVREINAAEMMEEIVQIYMQAGKDYTAITSIEFPMEEYPILTELDKKLDRYVNSLDENLYTDQALEKIEEIYWIASDDLMYAESRAEAQTIYDKAISKMKAVPTKKKEIAAFKKKVPKIKSVKAVNSTTLKITWKKVSGANGYVVYKASSKKGKYKKVKTVKKGTKMNNTRLKKGKKYYYKVRAYKTVDKKKYYSKYSKVKKGIPVMR
ncbi:fibronectin type III domain-containing protein [Anaerovorax odorimutans]|uniref:Fibronectin type III domain-containing protein n=1 Tax=Anaerovorax odorimutans TaxID=109327 RepID=A0ABT1RM13_9FIRM|nr:fibronectin type III domain-containing protein [Anaerovorax odorimutans]MCQ4636218.1 fibronectin type III domain-containing protein [Anaerovorax odorimutans]